MVGEIISNIKEITINVSGLNSQIKRKILSEGIKK